MPELHLQRVGDMLETRFGELSATAPWSDIALLKLTKENAYTYGRDLFELVTQNEQLRNALTKLPRNTRIVLLAEQQEVAAIHWEYMRLSDGTLLAARHNLVRGIPESQRQERVTPVAPLNIVAIPVSPLNESRVLNTEGEWRKLAEIVVKQGKALTLTRVRPPTRSAMMGVLGSEGTTIVQFMGHSNVGVLLFEDEFGNAKAVNERDFVNALDGQPYLVIMNSCYSAVSSGLTFNGKTLQESDSHLGNIARAVVLDGIPYALGMQFALYDYIALKITDYFYEFLLKSNTVEDAVRKTRARLEDTEFPFEGQGKEQLPTSHWLAGVSVLYTNQRKPAPALTLNTNQPTIQPDPVELVRTCDLNALPTPAHFVGRGDYISEALKLLLNPSTQGFVVLHGLGGIGKTALSRVIAERISYHYDDHVFAYSFETFTHFDSEGNEVVNEQFAATFYSTLATYYGLDPRQFPDERTLQNAIITQRKNTRSLLVLDNIETLIEAQKRHNEAANQLASFVIRFIEDKNVVLLTSRDMPPSDWGHCTTIELGGLDDFDGAKLFLTSLADDRRDATTEADRIALAQYVKGHPLSIRLLAGRFSDDSAKNLHDFLTNVQNELASARQKTPRGEDPNRHATLSECLEYSIRRLTDEQKKVLYTVGIFIAPFLEGWAEVVLDDEEQTRKFLQDFERLGLLESSRKDFEENYIILYEMHPMLRQHIKAEVDRLGKEVRERYGLVYVDLAIQARKSIGGYDSSATIRYLVIQSLADFEAVLKEEALSPVFKSSLAYCLAEPYVRRGQIQQAISLYEMSLATFKELGDKRNIAVTQKAIAEISVQQGKVDEAMMLYEVSLAISKELKNMRDVAVIQDAMAKVLVQQGKVDEAMMLYEVSLAISKELKNMRGVAVIQDAMAEVLVQQGKVDEAMTFYEVSLATFEELGDKREIAVTQGAIAKVLVRQGKINEAMMLYEMSLATFEELGDKREIAAAQHGIAEVLMRQGKVGESLRLCEESLTVSKELGEVQAIAIIEANYGQILWQQGYHSRALQMIWAAYKSLPEADFLVDTRTIQSLIISLKENFSGGEQQFDTLWRQATCTPQPDWLCDIQSSSDQASVELDEEAKAILEAIAAFVNTPDWDATQHFLEERQDILFQNETEKVFEWLIKQMQDDEKLVQRLEIHLSILHACKADGIEKTFERIKDMQAGGNDEDDTEELSEQQAAVEAFLASLSFDAELISRSIEALSGGSPEKIAHMQYLTSLVASTDDEQLKALINAIQLAMFGGDMAQLGEGLTDVYKVSWDVIVANAGT